MADIEKVIKGLETCSHGEGRDCFISCPYFSHFGEHYGDRCFERLASDTIELLKEQQKQNETIEDKRAKTTMLLNYMLQKESEQSRIVRCKDCKHGVQLDDSNYFVCSRPFASNRETHTADWFCADGERKENGIRMDDRAEERT